MLPSEKAAIDHYMVELTEALKPTITVLIDYLVVRAIINSNERDVIEGCVTRASKLTVFFSMLKEKDTGWQNLLFYLHDHNQSHLANKLRKRADRKSIEHNSERSERSPLEVFSYLLAHYYLQNYADVPTMGESTKHVKDVWVPLQLDGKCENHLPADLIDHVKLLNRLQSDGRRNVVLIKGDPGMGKTTLAKKIAYDWAANYGSDRTQLFSLVLAVPLRSAGKSNRFDHLAIDYFLSILDIETMNKEELVKEIKQLNCCLLVILDGLDEYRYYSESPFEIAFAESFQKSVISNSVPMPKISFKMIITSRPYACQLLKDDFSLLRFVITPLEAHRLGEFVRLYCSTLRGIDKVKEYLKSNVKLVIQVPLILTFVCYLADSVQEIPTNVTSLYDSFIRQMLKREVQKGKLAEPVDLQKWKESNLVKTTCKLAFEGSAKENREYDFSVELVARCHVANDSFVCGFLLHKYDPAKDTLMVDFPHRSVQEFFAALHFYYLMLEGHNCLSKSLVELLSDKDCQVGRFLFGICSLEQRFDQMADWLYQFTVFSEDLWFQPTQVVNLVGLCLADCSTHQQLTIVQRLFDSIEGMKRKMISSKAPFQLPIRSDDFLHLDSFPDLVKEALHLGVLTNDSSGDYSGWFVAAKKKSARLTVAHTSFFNSRPRCPAQTELKMLEETFTDVDTLIWYIWNVGWLITLDKISSLPKMKILSIIMPLNAVYTIATVSISYCKKSNLRLTHLRLHYYSDDRALMLSRLEKEQFGDVIVDERYEFEGVTGADEGLTFRQLKVTVNDPSMSQSTLIFSLIRLSVQ